jgi:hypothetical protein
MLGGISNDVNALTTAGISYSVIITASVKVVRMAFN